jgi:hypothetical protein
METLGGGSLRRIAPTQRLIRLREKALRLFAQTMKLVTKNKSVMTQIITL